MQFAIASNPKVQICNLEHSTQSFYRFCLAPNLIAAFTEVLKWMGELPHFLLSCKLDEI